MSKFPVYTINDLSRFDSINYPEMVKEIVEINKEAFKMPASCKVDILISFSKNHFIKANSLNANPAFVNVLTSGNFSTAHIQSLFEAGENNIVFTNQYEDYLKSVFFVY